MNALITACLLATAYAAPSKLARTCGGKPADVVFVIDSSSSIWEYDFKTYVLPFVRDVTSMFDVGPKQSQSRVGLVTFGDNYYLRFHLNRHMNKDYLMKRIMTIGQTGGNTNTAGVLNYVTDRMFQIKNGMRPDVDHIVIILTDGESMNYEKTKEAASRAHKKGLQVFAIGVGGAVDDVELSDIASDPDSQFKFHATDFKALQRIKEELAIKTCEVPTTTTTTTVATTTTTEPTTTTTEPTTTTELPSTTLPVNVQNDRPISLKSCGGKPADVYFILDSSSSIWPSDFSNKMLKFVKEVSEIFDIGSKKTRVGVVTFSDDYKPIFGLNAYSGSEDLLEALSPENIPFMSGGTNTADAIKYVRETGFSRNVARPDVAHVAVLITDGMSMDPEATVLEAEAAKKSGIYMFAIGVGDSVDQNELTEMASQPSEDYVFNVNNFGALDTIKNLLAVKTCLVNSGEENPRDQEYRCDRVSADIVFGFDSFAMGQTVSHRVVDIITSMTNKMSLGGNRFSVLSNACSKHRDIPMTNIQESEQALGNMKDSMSSQIHTIIKKFRRYAFGPQYSARSADRSKVAVLFLDESTVLNRDAIIANARRTKASGIELFVVTMGGVEQSLVKEIASEPMKSHLIQADLDQGVSDISDYILKSLC